MSDLTAVPSYIKVSIFKYVIFAQIVIHYFTLQAKTKLRKSIIFVRKC